MRASFFVTNDHARYSSALLPAAKSHACNEEPQDLARAFRRGDGWATEKLIRETTPRVTRLVRRLLAWPADIDDVVHDVFVAALMARKSFRGDARFDTWITRIAVNRCRAHNRRQWIRRNLFANWRDGQPTENEGDALGRAVRDEQAKYVRQAVADLPQKYREVVVLFYLEQLPAGEVAKILGIKTNTVEKRLSRARDKLSRHLQTQ